METKDFGDVEIRFVEIKVDDCVSILVKGFVDDNGNFWFLAFSAAEQLSYGSAVSAVLHYCKHSVYMKEASGKIPEGTVVVIPEKDMYNLILHASDVACETLRGHICDELCHRQPRLCKFLYAGVGD